LLCGPVSAEVASARQFTEEAAQALKASAPGLAVNIDGDLQLTFRRQNGTTGAVDLTHLYAAYRLEPGRRDDLLRSVVASLYEGAAQLSGSKAAPARTAIFPQAAAAILASNIVPTIKSREWLDELKGKLAPAGQEPVFDDYNGELVIVYAENTESRIRYLTSGEKFGVPRDKLRKLAVGNLQRILPTIKLSNFDGTGIYVLDAGGDYNASLLLLDKLWTGERLKVEGDIVAALPVRDMLVVTGSKDGKGLQLVRSMAKKWFAEGPYSLTESLFVFRNGTFVKFGR
jgi:uncharacterized protein YtpQ (UPF0354 family)